MIGNISSSGSFTRALAYALNLKSEDRNLSKEDLAEKFPEVGPTLNDPGWQAGLRHRVIAGNMSGETEQELKREFAAVRSLRSDVKSPLLSMSVRKAPSDTIDLQTWQEIDEQTIESLGLTGCPFLVVQHRDKDDHIHILASRIRLNGEVVSDSKSYEKVEQAMREVEIRYGLEQVQGSRETYDRALTWWEHKLVQEKSILSPKLQMQARISAVLEDQPTTTQFINRLREAHGIDATFRLSEDGIPCGVAFRYGDVTLSGGALGRGYTWKKLQERGLTYDERDFEAIERAGERAGTRRQPTADQERTISPATRTISDAGRSEVNDQPIGGAIRETDVEYDGREVQSQQYSASSGVPRGSHKSNQAGLPDAEANSISGEEPANRYESIADESPWNGFTISCGDTQAFNSNPNEGIVNSSFTRSFSGMEQSATITRGNQESGLGQAGGQVRVMDVCNGDNLTHAGDDKRLYELSPSDSTVHDFRNRIRDAIRDMDTYMHDYLQEAVQYQASITVDPIESTGASVDAEVEVEDSIIAILEL
ncbi:MAG: relaxase/mobilization nuclease domain-containing protein [Acidobacteriota bacterium]|nr:relaxase/mobilization nuclease domain-containing protein [Acidobacteriota bacterium]